MSRLIDPNSAMTLLVTGHLGFVGAYVMRAGNTCGLVDANGQPINLLDRAAVFDAVQRLKPTAVIHLAAQSFVPEAFKNPTATYEANFIGTQILLEALRAADFTGRFLFVSSADVYGSLDAAHLPATEQTAVKPNNPYAVSKIAAETLCSYWHRTECMQIIVARPFNHIGPGQSTRFAIADFSKTIAEIRHGKRSHVLEVGDLDVTRDFTDVRDVVAAYHALLENGQPGEIYNICSGVERHLGAAVATLAELAGVQIDIQVDTSRFRKASQPRAVGSNLKITQHTGWQPGIDWRISLQDTLTYWEQQIQ